MPGTCFRPIRAGAIAGPFRRKTRWGRIVQTFRRLIGL
jgi:hypothetical protein